MNGFGSSGTQMYNARGFSLIEILMVLLVIGLSVGIVSLAFNPKQGEELLQDETAQFLHSSRFVAEHTVLAAEIIGLFVVPETSNQGPKWCYRWRRFRDQSWRPIANFIEDKCFPSVIEIEMIVEGELYEYDEKVTTPVPVLVFYPSGESTPFELALFKRFDSEAVERIEVDMMGQIYWRSQEERNDNEDLQ